MTIRFADPGGEYYFSLGITALIWNGSNGNIQLTNAAPAGRSTQYALANTGASQAFCQRNLGSSFSTLIAAYALYVTSITNNSGLVGFNDNGTRQCDLRINTSGNLFFTRNGVTQVGGNSANAITVGKWYYIEVKAQTATVGSMEVRVNGVVWLTVSGNFQQTGNANSNQVIFATSGGGTANTQCMKDLYVLDTGTGTYITYLGDTTVGVSYPNAAGVNQQWLPSSGTQVSCVQDGVTGSGTRPDGDSSYIVSSTAGDISDFAHQSVMPNGSVAINGGVVHVSYMRKDDASATRNVQQTCISNGTAETTANIALTTSYAYYFDFLETDPNTSAAWTQANFNSNASFGVKEIT